MRVRWTRIALAQLDEVQDYIAKDSAAAAYDVALALTARPEALLSQNPRAGRIGRVGGTRELVFAGLPYIIVYRVTDDVEIVAVVHASREWPQQF